MKKVLGRDTRGKGAAFLYMYIIYNDVGSIDIP